MKAKCWLIGDQKRRWWPLLQAARRDVALEVGAADLLPDIPPAPGTLIATDLECLQHLNHTARRNLSEQVKAGAICLIGGSVQDDVRYSLAPLAPIDFRSVPTRARGYRITENAMLPAALRGEWAECSCHVNVAGGLSEFAQPITLVGSDGGSTEPSLFVIEQGKGAIICDLNSRPSADADRSAPLSLLHLVENVDTRLRILGPLLAFDLATRRNNAGPVGCNIVIDDRPASLDYFNTSALRDFFGHLQIRCANVHVDFGWTPDQTRPSLGYIETLKEFNAGFVWHGLLHHVDHRKVANPQLDFARGRRHVQSISERYQVRFQPVMVFPYEKDTDQCVELLRREGFVAKAETPLELPAAVGSDHDEAHRAREKPGNDGFVVLTRDSIENVSRDRMLARAALGMPVIVAAHPRDVGLRRFAKIRHQGLSSRFNHVLDFFSAKNLRPQSLEELALNALDERESS